MPQISFCGYLSVLRCKEASYTHRRTSKGYETKCCKMLWSMKASSEIVQSGRILEPEVYRNGGCRGRALKVPRIRGSSSRPSRDPLAYLRRLKQGGPETEEEMIQTLSESEIAHSICRPCGRRHDDPDVTKETVSRRRHDITADWKNRVTMF